MLLGTKVDQHGETIRAGTQLKIRFHRHWEDFILDLPYALAAGKHCAKDRDDDSGNFKFMACVAPLGGLVPTADWTPQQPVGLNVEPKTPQGAMRHQ